MEQPRLRMQPGVVRLIRHFHLSAERHELIDRAAFGRSRVSARDDPELASSFDEQLKLWNDEAEPTPSNESDDEIDAVGGINFSLNHAADSRLSSSVDEEITLAERNL